MPQAQAPNAAHADQWHEALLAAGFFVLQQCRENIPTILQNGLKVTQPGLNNASICALEVAQASALHGRLHQSVDEYPLLVSKQVSLSEVFMREAVTMNCLVNHYSPVCAVVMVVMWMVASEDLLLVHTWLAAGNICHSCVHSSAVNDRRPPGFPW